MSFIPTEQHKSSEEIRSCTIIIWDFIQGETQILNYPLLLQYEPNFHDNLHSSRKKASPKLAGNRVLWRHKVGNKKVQ
jgi:hypothetical protein